MCKLRNIKKLYFLVLVLAFQFGYNTYSQETKEHDTYKLYREGEAISKRIIYMRKDSIGWNPMSTSNSLKRNIQIKDSWFVFDGSKHDCQIIESEDFIKEIKFSSPYDISNLIEEEYWTQASRIEEKENFRPPPPIDPNHMIKIWVITKYENDQYMIQVALPNY